jgi:hypothetical protein
MVGLLSRPLSVFASQNRSVPVIGWTATMSVSAALFLVLS